MPKPFVPDKPEEKVTVTITKREAVVLQKLRQLPYGKILIHKVDGLIIRIEPTTSILIKPNDSEVDLE